MSDYQRAHHIYHSESPYIYTPLNQQFLKSSIDIPSNERLDFHHTSSISAAGSRIEEVDGIKLYPTHAWKDDMDPILEASGKMEEPRFSPNQTENPWEIFDKQVAFSMFWRGKKR